MIDNDFIGSSDRVASHISPVESSAMVAVSLPGRGILTNVVRVCPKLIGATHILDRSELGIAICPKQNMSQRSIHQDIGVRVGPRG